MENIKREPVLVSVLVGNVLALAAAFGLDLTTEQTAAIMSIVSTAVVVVFGRSAVTPNVSVVAREYAGDVVAGEASPLPTGSPAVVVAKATKPVYP